MEKQAFQAMIENFREINQKRKLYVQKHKIKDFRKQSEPNSMFNKYVVKKDNEYKRKLKKSR